jgi:adenylate cyclase
MEENRSGSILVVDDNEMNRDVLSRRLLKEGHQVEMAFDGMHALEILDKKSFDLVLLDVMMPGMSGYEVLDHIKKSSTLRHIPVLMISALTEMDSIVKCIELGAEDYLPKPFKVVLLNARVNACLQKKKWHDKEELFLRELQIEKKKTESLLQVILPEPVIEELKTTNAVKPRRYEQVAVLFCDVVSFTEYCDHHSPEEVVEHLQAITSKFEELTVKFNIEKIKTIGDAFMCTGGLLVPLENAAQTCLECGMEMIRATQTLESSWKVRIGLHVGPVMAGIVGHKKYLFDVWGDTVNTAARMQTNGEVDSISMTKETFEMIKGDFHLFKKEIDVRGKGKMEIYSLSQKPCAI